MKKTARQLIQEVDVIKSNLEYIAQSGNINGSLLVSLESKMYEYANQGISKEQVLKVVSWLWHNNRLTNLYAAKDECIAMTLLSLSSKIAIELNNDEGK